MQRRSFVLSAFTLALPAMAAGRTPASGAAAVVIFTPTAEVRGRVMRLGELARIECADFKLAETLRNTEVGTAPLIGYSRPYAISYARVGLRAAGLRDDQVVFQGPDQITVTRAAQTVTGEALAEAAIAATTPLAPGCTLRVTALPRPLKIGMGTLTLTAREPRLFTSSASVQVEVRVEGSVEATVSVEVRLLRAAPTLVAARLLPLGTVLAESDLRVVMLPQTPGSVPLSDTTLAVGRQLTAEVAEGAPIVLPQLRLVPLVHRGTHVKVICRSGSVAIACTGEAQQDGVIGQTIRVRNLASQLDFTARVVGADLLEMVF